VILTLAWKEVREHQGVWLTMVAMTVVLSLGLAWIVSLDDPRLGMQVGALTILGMAATYGVVCGSMMIAGEHEGGTLVYLDIFLGRRWLLWLGKVAVGVILVIAQTVVVSLGLWLLKQEAPSWVMNLVGKGNEPPDAKVWMWILPMISLCGFSFGVLGSSLSQRVLAAAAGAALGVTPVWLLCLMAPPFAFYAFQAAVALVLLAISCVVFVNQPREVALGGKPESPDAPINPKDQFMDLWDQFEREDELAGSNDPLKAPVSIPIVEPLPTEGKTSREARQAVHESKPKKHADSGSPLESLWWLTFAQAKSVLWGLLIASLALGLVLSANTQLLWPLATLLLGLACGTATFAPEQRDLSCQFLSAQHFPLKTIWRFKVGFWLAVAVSAAVLIMIVHFVLVSLRAGFGNVGHHLLNGNLPKLLGPTLFLGIWLAYGFCSAQIIVWLCRRTILALLVSLLVALGALLSWLPSLLCGGMNGWPVWAPPLGTVLASWLLMRAWASGRLGERKPSRALIGFASLGVLWVLLNFGYRAFHIADVGLPFDTLEFRDSMPLNEENAGAKAINDAINRFGEPDQLWLKTLADLHKKPTGVLVVPRKDGSQPNLSHLSGCRKLSERLREEARRKDPASALEHLAQVLALSRNLRNRAPVQSYVVGAQVEDEALEGLSQLLARGKPTPKLLRDALNELNRHAKDTPPPRSCLEAECYRSLGTLSNPNSWSFRRVGADRVAEPWLAGGIAVSLEMPWEAERNARIWQLVWAGLFRAVETPHWDLPASIEQLRADKNATRAILQHWLPDDDGAGLTRAQLARIVDASWLADEQIFCDADRVRGAAIRARWRVDATRQAIALSLYRIDNGKPVQTLQDLVPNYLPGGLPVDPYSGQSYRYSAEQGRLWSTGPDRIDHGGRNQGDHLSDVNVQWSRGELDLVTIVPHWP
jgi:hypothetical protein